MTKLETAAVVVQKRTLAELREQVRTEPEMWYAILDACDEPRVPIKLRELAERSVCLYKGQAERDYWAVAPYVARLDEILFHWIVQNLWKDPWGVFVRSVSDLGTLRSHFRRCLWVENPERVALYFRFYDPRVLSDFLETCTQAETKHFFGPVDSFCVSSEDGQLEEFTVGHTRGRERTG
jgi:hypothetical protein